MIRETAVALVLWSFVASYFNFMAKNDLYLRNNAKPELPMNAPPPPTGADYETIFLETAKSLKPTSDKVDGHSYQLMYGQLLLPYYRRKPWMKMFEIGLECEMKHGPGPALTLWRRVLPRAQLWKAASATEAACVEKHAGAMNGTIVLMGDQGDVPTLNKWIEASGRAGEGFDVIVDDGGHQQCAIWTSFRKLWPGLLPGGIYFIEDLHVSRWKAYNLAESRLCKKGLNVVDRIKAVVEGLVRGLWKGVADVGFVYCQEDACAIGKHSNRAAGRLEEALESAARMSNYTTDQVMNSAYYDTEPLKEEIDRLVHRQPSDFDFIFCHREACVFGKHSKRRHIPLPMPQIPGGLTHVSISDEEIFDEALAETEGVEGARIGDLQEYLEARKLNPGALRVNR